MSMCAVETRQAALGRGPSVLDTLAGLGSLLATCHLTGSFHSRLSLRPVFSECGDTEWEGRVKAAPSPVCGAAIKKGTILTCLWGLRNPKRERDGWGGVRTESPAR